jgi:hypothetical protein
MKLPLTFKTGGYLVSCISVLLLGAVAWDGAKDKPLLLLALGGGVATSLIGMVMRWIAFVRSQKDKEANQRRIARLEDEPRRAAAGPEPQPL